MPEMNKLSDGTNTYDVRDETALHKTGNDLDMGGAK